MSIKKSVSTVGTVLYFTDDIIEYDGMVVMTTMMTTNDDDLHPTCFMTAYRKTSNYYFNLPHEGELFEGSLFEGANILPYWRFYGISVERKKV